jgi:hypothetical protein
MALFLATIKFRGERQDITDPDGNVIPLRQSSRFLRRWRARMAQFGSRAHRSVAIAGKVGRERTRAKHADCVIATAEMGPIDL